jgi:hypothetical protein
MPKKTRKPTLKEVLKTAKVEKDVENAYRHAIREARPLADITSPYGCDGYAVWSNGLLWSTRLLLEAKYDKDLGDRWSACATLGQALFYVKRFAQNGEQLPNVIMVADKDECFVLATSTVQKFLDLDIDWSVAPSTGSQELTQALYDGANVSPFTFKVEQFKFRDVIARCEVLARGNVNPVRVTLANLDSVFHHWSVKVFADPKLTPVEQVDLFLQCLFRPKDVFLHPKRLGILVAPGYPEGVKVSVDAYRAFFEHYRQGYKPSEIDAFYAEKDRLVEDATRRWQGAFFTPPAWVEEGHRLLARVLGPNWRDECLVWDNSAGTANLTRAYKFSDLILSTAERPDVAVIRQQEYNSGPGTVVFQYDFLNPDVDSPFFEGQEAQNIIPSKAAERLKSAAEAGKRLVFLMNPPYAEHGNAGVVEGDHKAGVAKTLVNAHMKAEGLGLASQQLYAQFLFRCEAVARFYGFKEYTVAAYTVPTFISSSGAYTKFRKWWYDRFSYQGGFIFQASHFTNVSDEWCVSFTVWNNGSTPVDAAIEVTVKDIGEDFNIRDVRKKVLYASDGRRASDWVRDPVSGLPTVVVPKLSSGLKVKDSNVDNRLPQGALGTFVNHGNSLAHSRKEVFFLSAAYSSTWGVSLMPSNWRRCVAVFAARKLVLVDWDTDKDEYLIPDVERAGFDQWVDDAHIFCLGDYVYNCATAMRDVPFRGKYWRIRNPWFWRPLHGPGGALDLFDNTDTPHTFRDAKDEPAWIDNGMFGEGESWRKTNTPYLAHVLPGLKLSADARAVLDQIDALLVKSMERREQFAESNPAFHLTAWDAGMYQLKHLFRTYEDDYEELVRRFERLRARLQPGVYNYGFLRK